MSKRKQLLTLDSYVFIGAVKGDERYRADCLGVLRKVPDSFILAEPSIVYQEVCGTIARRVGPSEAHDFAKQLDRFIPEELLFDCDKTFCLSVYPLCSEFGIYATDALYLGTALSSGSILVSLNYEDFVARVKKVNPDIEVFHVSDFPYH